MDLKEKIQSKDTLTAYANAMPFLEVTGDTIMAWMLLWRAMEATQRLDAKPKKKDIDFYKGQLKSAQFFINTILPVSMGKMGVILASDNSVTTISEKQFA